MTKKLLALVILGIFNVPGLCSPSPESMAAYPHVELSNKDVTMRVYLPDPKNGIYRGTRYDWSGVIGSARYKGHEYFGFWRDLYDPEVGMLGPADTYKNAGLGYDEAKPGEKFIRIGVGFLEKENEPAYDYHNTYKLVDHGKWKVDHGEDWISFTHTINSDFGYGYIYKKTVRLKSNGYKVEYSLKNTGERTIETDQYSHNFIMVDQEKCGPDFKITYPYPVSTRDDLKGLMEVRGNSLHFTGEMDRSSVFMALEGYGRTVADNKFTIENAKTGAGVTVKVDQPLVKLEFWTNGLVICPENTMLLRVEPGKVQIWTSECDFFVQDKPWLSNPARSSGPGRGAGGYTEQIQRYGHGFSEPHDFTPGEYAYIANNYSIFTVEKRHAYADYGQRPNTEAATIGTAKKLKKINPDIKVLMYWNIVLNWNHYESQSEFNQHPEWRYHDWVFKSVNIDPVPTYDLNNPEVQEWWVNAIVDPVLRGDLDGVFLDAAPKVPKEQYESLFKMIDMVRARIGEDKIVIYNGFRVDGATLQGGQDFIEHASGVFVEFFLHEPLDTKEEAALLFDNLIEAEKRGKMIIPRGNPKSVLPGTKEPFLFSLASFLIFYGPNSYYLYNSGYNKSQGMLEGHPEFDLATGKPLGSAVRSGWVYTRDYEKIRVTVDLETKEAKIESRPAHR